VGDIKDDVDPEYMPSHLSDLAGDGYTDLTDNWYADVNGSDYKPDVYIGRFAVKDNVNLSIIANKTIRYENETSFVNQEWLKKISFINAADITNPDINNINDTFNTIKSSYTDQFGFTYEDIIPAYDTTATDDIMGNISDGVWITNYEGGGNRNNWVYSAGNGFGCPNVPSLTNGDNLTIVFSFASATGHFNNTNGAVTFTECMSLADNKGAVAFLGASGEPTTSPDLALNRKIFEAIFENNSATLGEAIKAAKDVMVDWSYYSETEIYNLLGDPALRIKDYTDSNISLDSPSDNTVDNDGVVGFNFTVTETNLDTCELYGNWSGGWHVNQSYNGFTQGLTQNFSDITLSDGSYYWNVYCNDSNGNSNFSALNYSLTVDSTYPSISLSTPTNGSSWTSSQTVTFTYSVSDLGVSNCSLIINDAVNSTTTGSQSFSITLLNSAYNWSVNCTDNANQENSSEIYDLIVSYSPQDTTPSGGGGGSSSGSVSNGGSVSETVSIATGGGAGETKTLSFSKDVAVTELGITLQNKVSSITLSVEKLTAKPADTTIPTGTAYHYLKIDKNLNDEDVKNAKIKFKVEKSWLTKNGFLAEEILLKRYVKTWEKLSTAYLKSDKDYAYYEADSKGFSYFAITAEKKPAPATTPEIKKEEEKPAEEQPPIKTEEPELKKLNYALYALLLALAAIIIVLLFKKKKVFKTKEKPSKELLSFEELTTSPKIKNFCKEKLSQGYTEKQILESAKEVGWTEEEIRKILNGLKK
jgi:PGF-pre-PGF domain-containing protein